MRMRAPTSFPLRRFAVLLGFATLALVLGCEDESTIPAGPEDQSPSFYHDGGVGEVGDGSADHFKILEENLAGDGTQVCNDSRLQHEDVVGDDEGTWRGKKIDDPPEDDAGHGFTLTLHKGKKELSWTDDGPNLMQAVLIKAGASSVVYYYNEGEPGQEPDPVQDFADDELDGEDKKQISHYVYCFIPQPSVVRGAKFDDTDGDGAMGADESALGGWKIHAYVDSDDTGTLDATEISAGPVATTTTAGADDRLDEGHYELRLDPGDYVICEGRQESWNQSAPSGNQACEEGSNLEEAGHAVSLAAGESDEGNDFGNNQSTIEVTVLDGTEAVEGHTVVAIHEDNGPYRNDGSLQVGQTDGNGFTVIGDLEPGAYCVRTSPLGVPTGRVVPPSDPGEAPSLAANLGTAVTGDPDETGVALTLPNFKAECLNVPDDSKPDKPFINLGAEVTLRLVGGPEPVTGSFQTLDGEDNEISAWMVADLTDLVPWTDRIPATDVAAVKIGLFVTAAQDGDGASFSIQTPGGPTIIESDKVPVGDNGSVETASASADGSGKVGSIATEPLFCVAHEVAEDSADGGQVEFKGPYRHGFLADAELKVLENAFGISYAQTPGEAKLKLRARSKNTKRLVVDYACEDDTCEVQKESGSLAKRVDVKLGTAGDQRVRWVISGLPQGTELVQSGVSGPGDDIPDPERDDNNDGLVEAALPDACESGGSTWVIGG